MKVMAGAGWPPWRPESHAGSQSKRGSFALHNEHHAFVIVAGQFQKFVSRRRINDRKGAGPQLLHSIDNSAILQGLLGILPNASQGLPIVTGGPNWLDRTGRGRKRCAPLYESATS
jgi:hypothetical protein